MANSKLIRGLFSAAIFGFGALVGSGSVAISAARAPADLGRIDGPGIHYHTPELAPRDASEWQGMRVDLNLLQGECDVSERCGLGMACVDGACGPCVADDECGGGEACVLDHCVPKQSVACRSAADCGEGEVCALSPYSPDVRGNAKMTATCVADEGGARQEDAKRVVPRGLPVAPPSMDAEALLSSVRVR